MYDIDHLSEDAADIDYTHSQCALLARWQVSASGTQPQMIEWSVSIEGATPGQSMMEPT